MIHRTTGKGEGYLSLTPLYQFHPLKRHLDISRAITAESLPLHIASWWSRTGNLWNSILDVWQCSEYVFTIWICNFIVVTNIILDNIAVMSTILSSKKFSNFVIMSLFVTNIILHDFRATALANVLRICSKHFL